MTGLGCLVKKELREQLRTHRLLVVGSLFTLFGLVTPLLVKMLPQIVRLAGEQVPVELPPPTAFQAIEEYASTMGQMGLLAAILVGMGAIAREVEQGTAAMTLGKPVSRGAFVVAKMLGVAATFVLSLAAAVGSYFYTVVLFEAVNPASYLYLNLLLGEFLLVCLAVTLLCSTMFRSQLAAGGLALALLIGQSIVSALPWVGRYLPGSLVSLGMAAVKDGSIQVSPAVAVGAVEIGVCLLAAWWMLRRKEL